ncbi:MAG: DUF2490 domain-containing protein [Chitinophagaceae bacterium]|nr:DUF2490 domain-containing protein [Chitinophagaceae bacterium]
MRTTFETAHVKGWQFDTELQHRRQNGYHNQWMMSKNLMYSVRTWLHYRHNNQVNFSISPLAYFYNYKIIQGLADETASPSKEIRMTLALAFQHRGHTHYTITYRPAIEGRLFISSSMRVLRIRNRLSLQYRCSEKIKCTIYNEVLCNAVASSASHLFDHNRTGLGLEYNILPRIKAELGYCFIIRLPSSVQRNVYESNVYLNLMFLQHTHRM